MQKQQLKTARAAVIMLTSFLFFQNGQSQTTKPPMDSTVQKIAEVEVFGSLGKSMENIFLMLKIILAGFGKYRKQNCSKKSLQPSFIIIWCIVRPLLSLIVM